MPQLIAQREERRRERGEGGRQFRWARRLALARFRKWERVVVAVWEEREIVVSLRSRS